VSVRVCRECDGEGIVVVRVAYAGGGNLRFEHGLCPVCEGSGWEQVSRSGCLGVLGLTALFWILVAVAISALLATPRSGQTTDRVDVSPVSSAGLSGAPRQTSRPSDRVVGTVSEVGSDAPYPADPRLSTGGAP
jgi:hypothetical protein